MLLKKLKTDWFFISAAILIAVFIRSLNFSESLNFSTDQAMFSMKSLEIIRGENEGILLKGPPISLKLENQEIYQGGIIYYFQALFLFLGNLDPVTASYLFMLFSCLMIIPLYIGTRFLINDKSAKLITILYVLSPIFIDYTKFFWNPNFQLSLLPLLFLFLGLYKKQNKSLWIFIAGIWFGIILQFHYQLFIGGIILLLYLKIYLKIPLFKVLLFISGAIIGFLPIIIYEAQHNYPNFNNLIFYLENFNKFRDSNSDTNFFTNKHYFLSLIMIIIIFGMSYLKDLNSKIIYGISICLIVLDLILYSSKPSAGFGMSKNWQYQDEVKVNKIIREENVHGYNIANLIYNSQAKVQKYFHKKDQVEDNLKDYWETSKIFVIAPKSKNITENTTYEIQVIKPFMVDKEWDINPEYKLYLLTKI